MCRKELGLLRKSNKKRKRSKSSGELVVSFLENKGGDIKNQLLCKLYIDETKIAASQSEEESHSSSVVRNN
jgi:hypothetical protein